jgi:hypothetical protein
VLSCITDAPLLQDLWISCTATATRALTSFVLRSSCHLRKLVIHECAHPRALVAVLRAVPTLTAFFVAFIRRASGFMDDEEHLFDALKTIVAGVEICPNLIHIAAGGHPGFAVASFLDMVQTRPLLSFVRTFYSDKRHMPSDVLARIEDAVARIAGLKGAGLDVALHFGVRLSQDNYLGMGRPCVVLVYFHGISSPNLDWLDFRHG